MDEQTKIVGLTQFMLLHWYFSHYFLFNGKMDEPRDENPPTKKLKEEFKPS